SAPTSPRPSSSATPSTCARPPTEPAPSRAALRTTNRCPRTWGRRSSSGGEGGGGFPGRPGKLEAEGRYFGRQPPVLPASPVRFVPGWDVIRGGAYSDRNV